MIYLARQEAQTTSFKLRSTIQLYLLYNILLYLILLNIISLLNIVIFYKTIHNRFRD